LASSYLRREIKKIRNSLNKKIVISKSSIITKKLLRQPFFNYPSIFLYNSFSNEVSTRELFKVSRIKGKKIGFPKIEKGEIKPLEVGKEFKKGKFNIYEPNSDKEFVFENKTIIIIPLIIFDTNCNRIGFGKGYYDRFLSKVKGLKIGLGYDFQLRARFKKKFYDVRLDMIVTEKRIVRRIRCLK